MDYMELSDGAFFYKMLEIYESKKLEGFEFLRLNPQLVERLSKLYNSGFIKGGNLLKTRFFLCFIKSYNTIILLKEMLANPMGFDYEDRNFLFQKFNGGFYVEDLRVLDDMRAIRLFPLEDQELIHQFLRIRWIAKSNKELSSSYSNSISDDVRKILDIYGKYDNDAEFFVFLHDDFKVDFSCLKNYHNIIISSYYNSLCVKSDSSCILNDFSFNDIILVNKIFSRYEEFLNSFGGHYSIGDESEFVELYKLFDMINYSLSQFGNYTGVVKYIVDEGHIKYDDFVKKYTPIFNRYVSYQFSRSRRELITRNFKLCDLYNYTCVKDLYLKLVSRVNPIVDYINSSSDDMLQLIYSVKYFNNVTPSSVKQMLSEKIRTSESDDEIRLLSKFIDDYSKYYNEKRNDNTQSKVDLGLYISIVRQYLDSLPESVSEFFEKNSVDKKFFDKALNILKENNHPIYDEYVNYNEMLRKKVFSIVIRKAKNIIGSIRNGVLLEDGTVRDYDVIDYYSYTGLTFSDFLKVIKGNVSNEDYVVASRFVAKYKTDKVLGAGDINGIFNTSFVYVTEKDSEGNPISTYEITKEEKQHVIELVRNMHVPLTKYTWNIMFKRYVSENILNKKDEKTKVLK